MLVLADQGPDLAADGPVLRARDPGIVLVCTESDGSEAVNRHRPRVLTYAVPAAGGVVEFAKVAVDLGDVESGFLRDCTTQCTDQVVPRYDGSRRQFPATPVRAVDVGTVQHQDAAIVIDNCSDEQLVHSVVVSLTGEIGGGRKGGQGGFPSTFT